MVAKQTILSLELRSEVDSEDVLRLSLQSVELDPLAAGEVTIRLEAAPINPTDLGLLLGSADLARAERSGSGEGARISVKLDSRQAKALSRRVGMSICPGLEGAGVVVAAGEGCAHLLGKTVAAFGGGMFAQYRNVALDRCLIFPEGVTPAQCAASFVNPLTALCILDTVRKSGNAAFVHTAAASNLGQMLQKLCIAEGMTLINIVRRPQQVDLLRRLGARFVCDSSAPGFMGELTSMIRETGAAIAFDAIGGAGMPSAILSAMEKAFAPDGYSLYGSIQHKQLYIYGALDLGPIQIPRNVGYAWSVSGWLLTTHLEALDAPSVQAMKGRIVQEIDTVFASSFTEGVTFEQMLDVQTLSDMNRRMTGAKYLLAPNRAHT